VRPAVLALLAVLVSAAPLAAQTPPTLVIEAAPDQAPARARLASYDLGPLAPIVRLVGLEGPGPPMRVVLAGDSSEWARQVPPWTAGFAVGEAGLIVLFPSRSPMYPHDSLEDVLRHEVTHVLISRASGGRPVPRWFHEGLAVAVERPWGLGDRSRLASELLFGPRLGLRDIDALFGGGEGEQARAYSLSAAIVRDLISEHGADVPAVILRRVAGGVPFDRAVAEVTARSVARVEAEFWDRQRTWTMWVPLLASSTVLWLVVIGIGGLAVRRRRRRAAELRRRWESEERAARAGEEQAGDRDDTAGGG